MGILSIRMRPHRYKTETFLEKLKSAWYLLIMHRYGQKGVEALSAATPVDTGLTAASWSYSIEDVPNGVAIVWRNSNLTRDGDCIAILLQYGHGTGNGGYVVGRDYINPALRSVFGEMSDELWKVLREL